ncbi:hypothetical protein HMPREF3135_05950 [Corynebacterium sp. HMSC14H10]|nr:hypothetical protein HMPREF3135_05950 [Corynebacterium sp. HMSC14H10]
MESVFSTAGGFVGLCEIAWIARIVWIARIARIVWIVWIMWIARIVWFQELTTMSWPMGMRCLN